MVIVAGLIVIGLIVYFIIVPIFTANAPTANVNVNKPVNASLPNTNSQKPITNTPVPPPPAEVAPEATQASSARTIAIAFAERFATYSNQNNLANLDNLEVISTPAVWSFIKGSYRNDLLKSMPKGSAYYAMTSTALNANVAPISATEDSATVMMQRVESGTASKVAYATLDLKLKKTGDSWLVSWEQWEK
jgi:hypothetical protein